MDWLEIQFWKLAKWLIIKGYGDHCTSEDYEPTCLGCQATQIISWIDHHIEIIGYE